MNRLMSSLAALAFFAGSALAFLGAASAFRAAEESRNTNLAWHEGWNEQEAQCLDDPSCDLDRFDRRRERDNVPDDGFGAFCGAVLLGFVAIGLLLGGGVMGYETFSGGS